MAAPAGFGVLWSELTPALASADVAYANLEGPTAHGRTRHGEAPDPGRVFDGAVYSGWNRFNYHPSLARDLVASGLDVVSTANNHALDRGPVGIDRTLDALDDEALAHTGTRRRRTKDAWHTITTARGIRIAWLACATHVNHLPDPHRQVLRCSEAVARVPALAADADAVIVTPHWGPEYVQRPNRKQRRLARRLIDAGALAVIGSHPHVLQPWAHRTTRSGREGLIVYSLGNFVSHQRELPRRTSIVLFVALDRGSDGDVYVSQARYLPLEVTVDSEGAAFSVGAARPGTAAYQHATSVLGASAVLAPRESSAALRACDEPPATK